MFVVEVEISEECADAVEYEKDKKRNKEDGQGTDVEDGVDDDNDKAAHPETANRDPSKGNGACGIGAVIEIEAGHRPIWYAGYEHD